MDKQYLNKQFDSLKESASNFVQSWRDLQDFSLPTHGHFEGKESREGVMIDHKKVLSGHTMKAAKTMSAGFMGGFTSPLRPWAKLVDKDPDLNSWKPVRVYLEARTKILLDVMARSNFYASSQKAYLELGVFGTACRMIVEDFQDLARCRNFTCGEYYIRVDHNGRCCAFTREWKMKVEQIVREFGYNNCSDKVREKYDDGKYDEKYPVRVLVEKNYKRNPFKLDNQNMEYVIYYWETDNSDKLLRKSGFEENPLQVATWHKPYDLSDYGIGPGWEALGDTKQHFKMISEKLSSVALVNRPPIQTNANAQGNINLVPAGVTNFSGTMPDAGAKPVYQINPDIRALREDIELIKRDIDEYFFVDLFMMISQIDRTGVTAKEISEKMGEKIQRLGPVIDIVQDDWLSPSVDRYDAMIERAGLYPPPPKELQGRDLNIEYTSVFAQAQKMMGSTAVEQTVAFVGNLAAVKPEVLNVIDFEGIVEDYADMMGISPKRIVSKEEREKIKAEQQAQMQAQQTGESMMNVVEGAKLLSETKIGTNSALDGLLGNAIRR